MDSTDPTHAPGIVASLIALLVAAWGWIFRRNVVDEIDRLKVTMTTKADAAACAQKANGTEQMRIEMNARIDEVRAELRGAIDQTRIELKSDLRTITELLRTQR